LKPCRSWLTGSWWRKNHNVAAGVRLQNIVVFQGILTHRLIKVGLFPTIPSHLNTGFKPHSLRGFFIICIAVIVDGISRH
ncbi:hypothetical protein, partial [Cronobacter sakazakii]|uniref:hypothetical protein n=1 Tax=Cronobacter sakazakii TaxID=28141 RepID=UPI00294B9621